MVTYFYKLYVNSGNLPTNDLLPMVTYFYKLYVNSGNLPTNDLLPMVTYFINYMSTLITCLQMICCPW
jgi:hypothetical protein